MHGWGEGSHPSKRFPHKSSGSAMRERPITGGRQHGVPGSSASVLRPPLLASELHSRLGHGGVGLASEGPPSTSGPAVVESVRLPRLVRQRESRGVGGLPSGPQSLLEERRVGSGTISVGEEEVVPPASVCRRATSPPAWGVRCRDTCYVHFPSCKLVCRKPLINHRILSSITCPVQRFLIGFLQRAR
jgi:hypothetical protein